MGLNFEKKVHVNLAQQLEMSLFFWILKGKKKGDCFFQAWNLNPLTIQMGFSTTTNNEWS